MGKADLIRAMSSIAAQTLPSSTSTVVTFGEKISSVSTGTGGGSGTGTGFFYAESEVADIESEGYPLHVLKIGYDCDVDDDEREREIGRDIGKDRDGDNGRDGGRDGRNEGKEGGGGRDGNGQRNDQNSSFESSYLHGSCSHMGTSRVSLVFTAVPYDRAVDWIEGHALSYDVAVLVVDCRECFVVKNIDGSESEEGIEIEIDNKNGQENGNGNKNEHENSSTRVTISDTNDNLSGESQGQRQGERERGRESESKGKVGYEVEGQMCSVLSAQRLEILLPETLPRLYVANRSDLLQSQPTSTSTSMYKCGVWDRTNSTYNTNKVSAQDSETVQGSLKPILSHLNSQQLPPLLFTSTVTGNGIEELKNTILRVYSYPHTGIPLSFRGKNNDNKFKWVAGRVLCAVVTVALIASAVVLGRNSICSEENSGSNSGNNGGGSGSGSGISLSNISNNRNNPYRCISWIRRVVMRAMSTLTNRE